MLAALLDRIGSAEAEVEHRASASAGAALAHATRAMELGDAYARLSRRNERRAARAVAAAGLAAAECGAMRAELDGEPDRLAETAKRAARNAANRASDEWGRRLGRAEEENMVSRHRAERAAASAQDREKVLEARIAVLEARNAQLAEALEDQVRNGARRY